MNDPSPHTIQDWPTWQRILSHYQLGKILAVQPGGGTASPKIRFETPSGAFILRRRRPTASHPDIVAYDHAVIQAAYQGGLPVVPPLSTGDGSTWVREQEYAYELFPFVQELERFQPSNLDQLDAAANALARFHLITRQLVPPGRKDWLREHHIHTMRDTLAARLAPADSATSSVYHSQAEEMLAAAERLALQLAPEKVAALPTVIIHGDYTSANVSFRGNQIGGIFDFDWVSRQARLIDVGEAIQFFAFKRAALIDPDDIWSLVQSWVPNLDAMSRFLRAYQRIAPLSAQEAEMLPWFMQETWLGIRIRAMRKVPAAQQLEILAVGALAPLRWLQDNERMLTNTILDTR